MAGLFSLIGGLGSIAGGLDLADDIRTTGAEAAASMGDLAGQLQSDSQFKGYGVTTGLGTSTVNPDGTTNIGVGPDTGMQGSAGSLMGGAAGNFGAAAGMAQQGGFNPAYAQAMSLYGQNTQNPLMGQAAGMIGQGSANQAYGGAMQSMQGGMQGLAGQQAGAFGASQQAMMNAMGDTAGREQDIYNRAMAMQQPGLDAQRASQQAREFAQGRGGIRGSQFGGTAEDAATARAQAQAQNAASFQAMGQAQTEMLNQANMANQFGQLGQGAAGLQGSLGNMMGGLGAQNAQLAMAGGQALGGLGAQNAQLGQGAAAGMGSLGSQQAQLAQGAGGLLANIAQGQGSMGNQMYQNSFMPMQQQLQAMQVAQGNASMAQTGQLTGAGYGAQLGLGGIQTQVNADKAASELYGNLLSSGMDAIGSMGQAGEGFFESIKNFWN